jgi:hypothetical protein
MSPITTEHWLAVWERVRAGQSSAIEISPRQQVKLFGKHVAHIESRTADLLEALEFRAVWIGADRPRNHAVASIRSTVTQLDIAPGHPRPFCQAAIGGDLAVIKAVHALNEAKERLRVLCLEADAQALNVTRRPRQWFKNVYTLQAELYGRPDFDYLLAYQQLPVLTGLPELIAFKDAIARRTNRIARDVLLAKLYRMSGDAAARDIERVRRTPSSEIEFAIDGPTRMAKSMYVRFDGMDASGALCRNIRTNLPAVFRLGRRLPSISFPGQPGVRTHENRSRPTVTICKERFLETLPVRRYMASINVRASDVSS